ncbi:hypothetical protein D1013_09550 [Euzebyella marina]|uniref:Death-on-curing protein n=1 Tax=Euzebyella marina TaxID=1761453 RepID=A0A3G2L5P0_9FLAO|nr:hypothetical protein D1013_09550 [Euzebyella marina]
MFFFDYNFSLKQDEQGEIILYGGKLSIEIRLNNDTIWLNQRQMAELFDKDSDTIGLLLKNIFASHRFRHQ